MATHDYNLANADGATFRSDLNSALSAIVSQNSSASEPSTTFAYQFWADTTNDLLKQRNAANSGWITLYTLSTGDAASNTVPTAAIEDNAITLAKMAGGTDGELITYDASGNPATVAVGTSGQVLTSNGAGAAPTMQDAGGDLSFGGDTFGADKTIGSNDNYALSFETNATERLKLTNDGRGLSQFTAKAWANVDGTGNISFRDSHNCSSLTDNGTGDYTVNFTNNMGNAYYSAVALVTDWHICLYTTGQITTSSCRFYAFSDSTGSRPVADVDTVAVQIFGD